MQEASIHSIRIRIRFADSGWWNHTVRICMSCKILRQKPLSTMEMDDIYALPYMRTWHPSYEKDGGVPAVEEIKFSLTSNRGCFGGCSFCALTFHQGRIVQTRSHESLVEEAEAFTKDPAFKGYIHDVGGPTANFRHPSCEKQLKSGYLRTARPVSKLPEIPTQITAIMSNCSADCAASRKRKKYSFCLGIHA